MRELGHGFIPRVDARNYKAVERCLAEGDPGLFNEGLDLPWAILEGPWALSRGETTAELCQARGVDFLVDTQAWRYHDPATFLVEKFSTVAHAPPAPLDMTTSELRRFVTADLAAQASLGAAAYLLPGVIPKTASDDVGERTLGLIEAAHSAAPPAPRECIAFVGVYTSAMEEAHNLIDELPLWISGVYLQFTPSNPRTDSPSKLIDCLVLARHAALRGFIVIGGRLAVSGRSHEPRVFTERMPDSARVRRSAIAPRSADTSAGREMWPRPGHSVDGFTSHSWAARYRAKSGAA